jgi:hypothetical protein
MESIVIVIHNHAVIDANCMFVLEKLKAKRAECEKASILRVV